MTDASRLPVDDSPRGTVLDAHLHLLDRQIVDPNGMPIAVVDDLELDGVEDGPQDASGAVRVTVRGLVTGPVLWTRIFGGRAPEHRYDELPWSDVGELGVVIRVDKPADSYEASWTERWVRERVIGRIPGGRHAPD
ncbi:hypothetical protein GCM10022286_27590 [Gryllotalpicola daejeonensis]|uniref:Uncharacterized protein n=1 Tax=Gryllotalpicola daejeonensis TaxID=993087 RepID=A0ABP7ZMT1_9MICO